VTPAQGLLLVDKPQGWTSHDVVAVARRRFPKGTKVGHAGTLDPMATGLLVLLIGPYTRRQSEFMGQDKVYSGVIRLGTLTDTGDITGKVLEQKPVPPLTLESFTLPTGSIEMPAPAYSAVKHEGKALYKYARAGLEVPVKPRVATVHEWTALRYEAPDLAFRLRCSAGTYVRSLAELLGRRLGCGGTLAALRRDASGRHSAEGALPAGDLKTIAEDALRARLLTPERGEGEPFRAP
jgi:tRNA pseudouridine55 synthase